jgi:hypothetical protein
MKQFNWSTNWRRRVAPLLNKRSVVKALTLGMMMQNDYYEEGDPPWEHGRGPLNGQKAKKGCLSWYQPWGRCHYIAPFAWAIGKELYPDLEWGFISGDLHTVVIGYELDGTPDPWQRPEWMVDILLFRKMTAQQSLDHAKKQIAAENVPDGVTSSPWAFYPTFRSYALSFCHDPAVVQMAKQINHDAFCFGGAT